MQGPRHLIRQAAPSGNGLPAAIHDGGQKQLLQGQLHRTQIAVGILHPMQLHHIRDGILGGDPQFQPPGAVTLLLQLRRGDGRDDLRLGIAAKGALQLRKLAEGEGNVPAPGGSLFPGQQRLKFCRAPEGQLIAHHLLVAYGHTDRIAQDLILAKVRKGFLHLEGLLSGALVKPDRFHLFQYMHILRQVPRQPLGPFCRSQGLEADSQAAANQYLSGGYRPGVHGGLEKIQKQLSLRHHLGQIPSALNGCPALQHPGLAAVLRPIENEEQHPAGKAHRVPPPFLTAQHRLAPHPQNLLHIRLSLCQPQLLGLLKHPAVHHKRIQIGKDQLFHVHATSSLRT